MAYHGGKQRIARYVADLINLFDGMPYYEPFCGSLAVSTLVKLRPMYLSDAHGPLIVMHKALQAGWRPPREVSEALHDQYRRTQPPDDPLTAFIGFGCSFGGMYFKTYAREKTMARHSEAARARFATSAGRFFLGIHRTLKDAHFAQTGFEAIAPSEPSFIYCDPPYKGTEGFNGTSWDQYKFYDWLRERAKTNLVLLSEYVAPRDFVMFREVPISGIKGGHRKKLALCERLYVHESNLAAFEAKFGDGPAWLSKI